MLQVAEEAGSLPGQALANLMVGEVELLSGRVNQADQDLSRAAKLHEADRCDSGLSMSLERLGEAALAAGRRWQAGRFLGRAMRLAERIPLSPHLVIRVYGAMVEAASDPARSVAVVQRAEHSVAQRDMCEPCSMGFRVAAAICSARSGDLERARRHLDEAERIAGMWQGGPWLAAVWEARGALRLAEGDSTPPPCSERPPASSTGWGARWMPAGASRPPRAWAEPAR